MYSVNKVHIWTGCPNPIPNHCTWAKNCGYPQIANTQKKYDNKSRIERIEIEGDVYIAGVSLMGEGDRGLR